MKRLCTTFGTKRLGAKRLGANWSWVKRLLTLAVIVFETHWLPGLHRKPYGARLIANSSSCTTTGLSRLLTSYHAAVKGHVVGYCEEVYEIL